MGMHPSGLRDAGQSDGRPECSPHAERDGTDADADATGGR
jgi:hypothetical protein